MTSVYLTSSLRKCRFTCCLLAGMQPSLVGAGSRGGRERSHLATKTTAKVEGEKRLSLTREVRTPCFSTPDFHGHYKLACHLVLDCQEREEAAHCFRWRFLDEATCFYLVSTDDCSQMTKVESLLVS